MSNPIIDTSTGKRLRFHDGGPRMRIAEAGDTCCCGCNGKTATGVFLGISGFNNVTGILQAGPDDGPCPGFVGKEDEWNLASLNGSYFCAINTPWTGITPSDGYAAGACIIGTYGDYGDAGLLVCTSKTYGAFTDCGDRRQTGQVELYAWVFTATAYCCLGTPKHICWASNCNPDSFGSYNIGFQAFLFTIDSETGEKSDPGPPVSYCAAHENISGLPCVAGTLHGVVGDIDIAGCNTLHNGSFIGSSTSGVGRQSYTFNGYSNSPLTFLNNPTATITAV